ncbi:MAG: response regulator containing a CheY-like receiver domain protein and an DNA-binding domain [Pseudonocardia sp.]|uniref:response regulator n=1 Tax=Pseudonocardia sp. TaxID=60912 RepID=UPI002610B70B|nr:response regulator transcription factor [Pseudonocardia sp.]MCU1631310.1 response regulator containing a CheY-like receiver domain protein and an DNA-binding domain [Pseudonocardia sp.]
MSGTIRVLVVDDHEVVRSGLRMFLGTQTDIEVVGEAPDGASALAELAALHDAGTPPDVVLMDLMMPGPDGIATIARIRELHPAVRSVVLTSYAESQRVLAALDAGAAGYLLKDADAREVATAVRAARRDEVQLDPAVARVLARSMKEPVPMTDLTGREREVLALIAAGCSNREIGDRLEISERTARTHVSHVLGKLGLASRVQAALWAIKVGLVPAP